MKEVSMTPPPAADDLLTPGEVSADGVGPAEQLGEAGHDLGHQLLGGGTYLLVQVGGSQDSPVEVAHSQLGAAAPDGTGQYDAGVPVEPEPHWWTPTGRGGPFLIDALDDQAGLEEHGDPRRHCRAREPGDPPDPAARDGPAVTDQGEHLTRRRWPRSD